MGKDITYEIIQKRNPINQCLSILAIFLWNSISMLAVGFDLCSSWITNLHFPKGLALVVYTRKYKRRTKD